MDLIELEINSRLAELSDKDDFSDNEDDHQSDFDEEAYTATLSDQGPDEFLKLFLAKTAQQSELSRSVLSSIEETISLSVNEDDVYKEAICCEARNKQDEVYKAICCETRNKQQDEIITKRVAWDESNIMDDFSVIEDHLDSIEKEFRSHELESKNRSNTYNISMAEEISRQMDNIEKERLVAQRHIAEMEMAEHNILFDLEKQKSDLFLQKQNNSACIIQKAYRGFTVRKKYCSQLHSLWSKLKEERLQERINKIEQRLQLHKREKEKNQLTITESEVVNDKKEVLKKVGQTHVGNGREEKCNNEKVKTKNEVMDKEENIETYDKRKKQEQCNNEECSQENICCIGHKKNMSQKEEQCKIQVQTSEDLHKTEAEAERETLQQSKILEEKIENKAVCQKEIQFQKNTRHTQKSCRKNNQHKDEHNHKDENECRESKIKDTNKGEISDTSQKEQHNQKDFSAEPLSSSLTNEESMTIFEFLKSEKDTEVLDVGSGLSSISLTPNTAQQQASIGSKVCGLSHDNDEVQVPGGSNKSYNNLLSDNPIGPLNPLQMDNRLKRSHCDDNNGLARSQATKDSTKLLLTAGKDGLQRVEAASNPDTYLTNDVATTSNIIGSTCLNRSLELSHSDILAHDHFGLHDANAKSDLSAETVLVGVEVEAMSGEIDIPAAEITEETNCHQNVIVSSNCHFDDNNILTRSQATKDSTKVSLTAGEDTPQKMEAASNPDICSTDDVATINSIIGSTCLNRSLELSHSDILAHDHFGLHDANAKSDLSAETVLVGVEVAAMSDEIDISTAEITEEKKASISLGGFQSLLHSWREQRQQNCDNNEDNKPVGRISEHKTGRGYRRISSAAKKLPSFSEYELIEAIWPRHNDIPVKRSLETLNRIYYNGCHTSGHVRNLMMLKRCTSLTHLTIQHCGLLSLEGLQPCVNLKHVDMAHNDISFVSCDNMCKLESLVLASNKLMSIHGLSGCSNLLYLDLSHNHIRKISALHSLSKLAHLRIDHNELLNVQGLSDCPSLVTLQLSANHLTSLEGVANCPLLRQLRAADNQIDKFPSCHLSNSVLLTSLDLSSNHIETLTHGDDDNDPVWMPSLTCLTLASNRIERITAPFHTCMPGLEHLDVSDNVIGFAELELLMSGLQPSVPFRRLVATGNLVTADQACDLFARLRRDSDAEKKMFDLVVSEEEKQTIRMIREPRRDFLVERLALVMPTDCDASLESRQVRKCESHEWHPSFSRNLRLDAAEVDELKQLKGWKTLEAGRYDDLPPDAVHIHCDYLKRRLEICAESRRWFEGVENESCRDNKKLTERHTLSPSSVQHLFTKDEEYPTSLVLNSSIESNPANCNVFNKETQLKKSRMMYEKVKLRSNTSVEHDSAVKIQRWWRSCRRDKREHAACLIQASWKGFKVRRRIGNAIKALQESKTGEEEEEWSEVDLEEWDFDKVDYEHQWAYKTHFGRHYNQSQYTPTIEPAVVPSLIRQNSPLPPITPTKRGGTTEEKYGDVELELPLNGSSEQSTSRSHNSRLYEERIANEWLPNSDSILSRELLFKRAKKMRGKRRKVPNATDKLRKFHEMQERTIAPVYKGRSAVAANKIDYFKAREVEEDRKKSFDEETRLQFTYEWLHTSAHQNSPKQKSCPDHGNRQAFSSTPGSSRQGSARFLPPIRRLEHSLPSKCLNDLEVISLSSVGSTKSNRLLREIVRRHPSKPS